jgi:[glutamine synthetase] adenylyltransferase / [glutamine synthetase]-adenylyl-L-tyrosine phosphorylase
MYDSYLQKMFQASPFAQRLCASDPKLNDFLRNRGAEPLDRAAIVSLCTPASLETTFATLRHARRRLIAHLIYRDINGLADLDEVLRVISEFAEVTVNVALNAAQSELNAQYGSPVSASNKQSQHLLVVGMGKLGGRELNVSSDIDLIFVYAEDGETLCTDVTQRSISNHEFFARVGKRVIAILDQVDALGFVFRVDMRLRPFGDSGPLISSFAALSDYFIKQARPWERYAWLKGRVLNALDSEGLATQKKALMEIVHPFVFRRYHDYGAIPEMRDLHGQIRLEATKRNRLDDIKVGPGGIREIEFIAQLFQLIRGGREYALQTRSTRKALDVIAQNHLLDAGAAAQLQTAYAFLRNVEHRLQYRHDQQTQLLPTSDGERSGIAVSMGFTDWPSFLEKLNTHRNVVSQAFETVFSAPDATNHENVNDVGGNKIISTTANALGTPDSLTTWSSTLANKGYAPDAQITLANLLVRWLHGAKQSNVSDKNRLRLNTLAYACLNAAIENSPSEPSNAAYRSIAILEAIDRRETYLAMLTQYPSVIKRLVRVCSQSSWAAEQIRRHPILLDELVGAQKTTVAALVFPALRTECDAQLRDIERQYDLLRTFKHAQTLRLNIADIEGKLGVMELSDALSDLADGILDTTLVLAQRQIQASATDDSLDWQPPNWQPPKGFAIIGYGKLGSKELGYASDLDLVFLYDDKVTDAEHSQSQSQAGYFARYGQRVNGWLNTLTSGGILYETDLRLRPDGNAGVLVSGLTAYEDYQQTRAWTWEHQALTRARWCAGDPVLKARFDQIRNKVLQKSRDVAALKIEIAQMRQKMHTEIKPPKDRDGVKVFDLKHVHGGVVDIEFIVQFIVLAYSHQHAELTENKGNTALLFRAAALGILAEEDAAILAKAYLSYRAKIHAARNNNESQTLITADELNAERASVMRVWNTILG